MLVRSKHKQTFIIRPLEHLYSLEYASANQPMAYASFPSMNCTINQKSVAKRAGMTINRTLATDEETQLVTWYQNRNGVASTVFFTGRDICRRDATGTYTYLTPRYTVGTVSSISTVTVNGTGTPLWKTGVNHPVIGDKFIMAADLAAHTEPNPHWRTLAETPTDEGVITLTATYGATASGNYVVRRLYPALPANGRWVTTTVSNKLCFSHGNILGSIQYWDSDNTTALDLDPVPVGGPPTGAATPSRVKYLLSYANRLIAANVTLDTSVAEPWTLVWSKEGGPSATPSATDWSDTTTAGQADFVATESVITGLGRVLNSILIYKHDSIIFGNRTGIAAAPMAFPRELPGIGLTAPYSLVQAMGTNFFRSNDDFYVINGDRPEPIGSKIRDKFSSLVSKGNQEKMWGIWSSQYRMILWFVDTSTYGQVCFAYDYNNGEWLSLKFGPNICGAGEVF